jgi:hypothetical protein
MYVCITPHGRQPGTACSTSTQLLGARSACFALAQEMVSS